MARKSLVLIAAAGFGLGAIAVPLASTLQLSSWLASAGGFTRAAKADEPAPDITPLAAEANPFSDLYKIDGKDYRVTAGPGVSLAPLGASSVRKIGYGHVSEVRIVSTASGTYSTDGMASPHVLYPGLTVEQVVADPAGAAGLMYLQLTRGSWVSLKAPSAGSFVYFGSNASGGYVVSDAQTCVHGASYFGCS